jgi:DNA-directed RNA polymerase specialized sigma24 family protein
MSDENDLQNMPVDDLAQNCAQETDLYFNHHDSDSRYCFELFRRAIHHNDEEALKVVFFQYQPLVARWVDRWIGRQSDFSWVNEDAQDFIAQAFERFWISFTSAKFEKSRNIAEILKYLQMCVHGAIMDAQRKMRHFQLEQELGDDEQNFAESAPTPEELFQKKEFWQLIRQKCKDQKEYTVIYASFSLALSPREILAEYPGVFQDVKEIYQYKANLLERLERDDEFKDFARRR